MIGKLNSIKKYPVAHPQVLLQLCMKSGARIGIEALLLLSDLEKVKHHGKK
jgi:hypothetical protein